MRSYTGCWLPAAASSVRTPPTLLRNAQNMSLCFTYTNIRRHRIHSHPKTFYGSAQCSRVFYISLHFFLLPPFAPYHLREPVGERTETENVSSDFIYSVLSDSTIYLWESRSRHNQPLLSQFKCDKTMANGRPNGPIFHPEDDIDRWLDGRTNKIDGENAIILLDAFIIRHDQ